MIDAYEIGIQLALQDGVSAGLEVIGRELAEVDRAVAASSAGLAALTRTADQAVRAVAAAAGVRPPLATQVTAEPGAPVSVEPVVAPTAPRNDVAPDSASTGQAPSAAEATAPVSERAGAMPAGSAEERVAPVAALGPTVSAPQQEATISPVVMQQSFAAAPSMMAPPAGAVPIMDAGSASADIPRPAYAPGRETVVLQARGSPPSVTASPVVNRAVPMRASVAQAVSPRMQRGAETTEQRGAAPGSFSNPAATQQKAAASGMAEVETISAPRRSGATERPAAPQPQARERGEGGGGSVMLDGRLVGYWLTEQMAREASRPPGGTSFFDPRQAPAWTPSGAL